MRHDVATIVSVARQKRSSSTPEGLGHVASRHGWSYLFHAASSSPEAVARLALGGGEAFGSELSRGVFVDAKGPDLRGDPLGVVRREGAYQAVLPRPQGRHRDGHPGEGTGGDLPGVPQTVDHLDRRAGDGALRRPSPAHAIGPRRTLRGLRVPGLRRGWQPSRTAPHRIQRGAGPRRPKAPTAAIEGANG